MRETSLLVRALKPWVVKSGIIGVFTLGGTGMLRNWGELNGGVYIYV
jgi:hypothetical protein